MEENQTRSYPAGVPATQAEMDMHLAFERPNDMTKELLSHYRMGCSLLDIGCGPNSGVGEFVMNRGGRYSFCDKDRKMAEALESGLVKAGCKGYDFRVWDATMPMPYEDGAFDVTHTRFLLRHLTFEEQGRVIRNAVNAASQGALFLEWDWGVMRSSKSPEILGHFTNLSFRLMKELKVEAFMGSKLKAVIKNFLGEKTLCTVQESSLSEGDYTRDLVFLCNMQAKVVGRFPNFPILAAEFTELAERFRRQPIEFVPAKIVAVTVHKSGKG